MRAEQADRLKSNAMKIREKLNATVRRISQNLSQYRSFTTEHPEASPTLCHALSDVSGLSVETLARKDPHNIDALAGTHLGFSCIHCELIRLADTASLYGGLPYLDAELDILGNAGPPVVRFWSVLDALTKEQWPVIEQRACAACDEEHKKIRIQNAVAASRYLPNHYFLVGHAVVTSLTRVLGEARHDGINAAHNATVEIMAASDRSEVPLNYLKMFDIGSIEQLWAIQRCEP